MFKSNALTVSCCAIFNAAFPFIIIGMLWNMLLAYTMIGLAALSVAGLIAGLCMSNKIPQSSGLKDFILDLGFPYALTLSVTVTYFCTEMTDVLPLLWIPAFLALITVAAYVVKLKKKA